MTDLVELRGKAGIEIRSLLVSTPIGLTASQLKSDYFMFFGCQLPYRELGYYGVEDMAKDMPDVMRIKWERGTMILLAVSNESTDKISRMVSCQRLSKKADREKRARKAGYRGASSYNQRPSQYQHPSRYQHQQPQSFFVPASVRTQVTHLLKSYRIGLRMSGFEGAFSKRFGIGLNYWQYGFKSLLLFMNYLQDQRVISLERTLDSDYTVSVFYGSSTPRQYEAPYRPPQPLLGPSTNKQFQPVHYRPPLAPKDIDVIGDSDDDMSSDDCFTEGFGDEDISPVTKKEIQQLLSNNEDGILASKLKVAYKHVFQKELDFREMGFLSVMQFIGALSDIVRVERPNPSDWLLFDRRIPAKNTQKAQNENEAPTEDEAQMDKSRAKFDNEFKESLRQFLLKYKDGVLLSNMLDVYEKSQGTKLDAKEYGFPSFEALLFSLMDTYLNVVYVGNGQMMVRAIEFPSDSMPSSESSIAEPIQQQHQKPAVEPSLTYPKRTLPADVVGCGAHYNSLSLSHLDPKVSKDIYTEVYVSNIVSPGRFWLQLRGKSTTSALEDLMEALDFYGTSEGEKYRMPESYICVGMPCVVVFPEDCNWHRGVIVGMKDMDSVEVHYVDYGNTCKVAKSDLRLLRMKYLRLPCQAIQARLSHVAPPTSGWASRSLTRMMSMVGHKPVLAVVTAIKEDVLSVVLVDTSTEEDILINDTLVDEGYGLLQIDEQHFSPVPQVPVTLPEHNDGPVYIQPTRLTREHMVHLVNHNDQPHLISSEISAFFWDTDMLRSVLRKRQLDLKRDVISIKLYPDLFNQLKMYNVKGIWDESKIRPCVTLYELSGVSVILNTLNHPSEELKSAILDLNASFNPNDSYWKKGTDTSSSTDTLSTNVVVSQEIPADNVVEASANQNFIDTESSTDSDSVLDQLRTEELKVMLHTLQFRRNRLLTQMIGGNISEVEAVDEMELIEEDIHRVRTEIHRLETVDKKPRIFKHPPGLAIPQQTQSLIEQASHGRPNHPPVQVVTPTMSKKEETGKGFASINEPTQTLQRNRLDMAEMFQLHVPTACVPPADLTGTFPTDLTGTFPVTRPVNPSMNLQQQHLLLQSLMLPQGAGLNPAFPAFAMNPVLFSGLQGTLPQTTSTVAQQPNLIEAALHQQQQLVRLQQQQQQFLQLSSQVAAPAQSALPGQYYQQPQTLLSPQVASTAPATLLGQYYQDSQTPLSPQVTSPAQATLSLPGQMTFNPNQPLINTGLLTDLFSDLLSFGSASSGVPQDPHN